ncbi:MAG TPA: MFS transporter [Anaerolineales bacterium]|nr:MFS transporter [Anaerolineales bacterium]
MKNYLALVRVRPSFRYLWLAQVISLTGDWFNTIASVLLVNRYTDSGLAVGGLFLARALPPFLLGPWAGVVADRFNRKWVLIVSDLLRAVIVLGFLWVDRPERAWLLFALSVLQFSVSSFFEPARAAILPNLVSPDELITANTLSSATWSAMLAFGAALGGFTAALFGAQVALIIDSLSFVGSALFVFAIPYAPQARARAAHSNGLTDFVDGLKYVRQNPKTGLVTLVKAMGQIGSVDIIAATYAARIFRFGQEGAVTLGLMFAFFGLGAILGPVIGNALGVRTKRALQIGINVGFLCLPVAWFIIGASPTLPLVLLGVTLRGMGGSVNWTYSDVLIQMSTPDQFMGRVYSLDFGIFTLALSASVWFSGAALDQFALDPRVVALYFGLGSLLPLAFWTVMTRVVRLGEPT